MKKLWGRLFKPSAYRVGQGMRGRVHKISIIAGGEVSIVIRCGMDEPSARSLSQGALVEFFESRAPADDGHALSIEMHPMGLRVGSNPAPSVHKPIPPPNPPAALAELGTVSDTGTPVCKCIEVDGGGSVAFDVSSCAIHNPDSPTYECGRFP